MKPLLQQLTSMGLGLAIDNFGTGYCSLNYLRHFPFSKLKIDRSFVQAVSQDAHVAALTAAIIGMGKALRMRVIAECVENEEQVKVLRSLGCDQVQGYHFSQPLEASAFARMVQSHRLWRHNPLPIVSPRQPESMLQASSTT